MILYRAFVRVLTGQVQRFLPGWVRMYNLCPPSLLKKLPWWKLIAFEFEIFLRTGA